MNFPRVKASDGAWKKFSETLIDNKRTAVKVGFIFVVLLASILFRMAGDRSAAVTIDAEDTAAEKSESGETQSGGKAKEVPIYVDISGAVKKPGVYEVREGTRLFELIELAGGLSGKADIDSINQASFVVDGDKIIVPENGGEAESASTDSSHRPELQNGSSKSGGLVNINSADKESLLKIPGVGDVIADRIIEYRKKERFKKVEDIKNIKGIGDATFNKMKDVITV